MNQGFIKIEMVDGVPMITMEYDDLHVFKELLFLLISSSGVDLICQTIQKDLLLNNQTEELQIFNLMIDLLSRTEDAQQDEQFINPSSFK